MTKSAAERRVRRLANRTPARLAAASRTVTEEAFLNRFDRQLDDTAIGDLAVGNTLEGITFKGSEFLSYVAPDGSVDKMIDDRRDSSMWKIEDGMLCMQFTTLAQGQPFALRVYQFRDADLFKDWSPSEMRRVWFVVRRARQRNYPSGPIPTFASLGSIHPSKCRNQKHHWQVIDSSGAFEFDI